MACDKILKCGHRCGGIKGEKKHPECQYDDCLLDQEVERAGGFHQGLSIGMRKEDIVEAVRIYCLYCNENINRGPALTIGCGSEVPHFVHYACL